MKREMNFNVGQNEKQSTKYTIGGNVKEIRENNTPKSAQKLFRGEEVNTARGEGYSGIIKLILQNSDDFDKVKKVIKIPGSINVYQIDSPELFRMALAAAQKTSDYGAKVALRDVEEYKDAKLFLSENGEAGIAVASDGHIFSLFKNNNICKENNVVNVAAKMMLVALANGGKKLDCFDGFLPNLYSTFGFEPVAKIRFYKELTSGVPWNYKRDGTPDLIFMKHNGDSVDKVINNMGFYKKYDPSKATVFPSLEEAEKVLDKAVEELNNKNKKQLLNFEVA
jgi:hypothetical protein